MLACFYSRYLRIVLLTICMVSRKDGWLMKKFVISCIRFYQNYLSPRKIAPSCRFTPTCSEYAVLAVEKYGILRGGFKAAWRILRCNPFCRGGYDPLK